MNFDDDAEAIDFRRDDDEGGLSSEVTEVVSHLRETLTFDMAARAFQCRVGAEPEPGELEAFIDELVVEAYNAGYDDWDEEFLVYD